MKHFKVMELEVEAAVSRDHATALQPGLQIKTLFKKKKKKTHSLYLLSNVHTSSQPISTHPQPSLT
ncbi:hypothetical protein, partial [Klebsiella pneumoniae]|uniref:hypothetical protein n=1 Tax=Klebsiella pneumoniae TaxID=573 RepID=UPI0027302CA9